ncbi:MULTISPECIES: GH25 family lysozyme [unclassified Nocardioides]|uniref:GH25 family lysozyme n=1 Tax=unclassified Nocardioides TaxID=2615069 RepID=UPI003607EF19
MPTATAPFRIITANVQSFPPDAMTTQQALADLTSNAADGDLVLLQEIAPSYRPLVQEAFPSPEWDVYYGKVDNSTPIAFRKAIFARSAGDVTVLHEPHPRLHRRRYITHVRLRHRALGIEFHVTNLHLVAGAFNNVIEPDQALRVQEWNEGIAKHRLILETMVASGLPVMGGGDYNRQLRRHKSLGTEIAGRPLRYAVDPGSIDLLWFIDGDRAGWKVRSKRMLPGRNSKDAVRNSDHAAREATVMVTASTKRRAKTPTTSTAPPQPKGPPPPAVRVPGPFELTTFGDGTPKKVDQKTRAALEEAERRLGYRLTVVQGSYNAGRVAASAGTHDAGGVVDLLAWDWRRKVKVLRAVGFAAWYRPTRPGTWNAHIHAVLVDHGNLSAGAKAQVAAYRAGGDGLAGNRADDFPRPNPIPVFKYPPAPVVAATPDGGDGQRDGGVEPLGKAYPPRRTLDGVDISHHQSGRLDLAAARAAGLRWLYVKATEGTSFKDQTHRKRVRQARAAGLPVGAYHFARPEGRDAAAEAQFFLKNIELRAGDMVPMLDLEDIGDLTLAQLTEWTGVWVRTVTQAVRHKGLVGKPVIYTPFNLENGFGCLLWVARYSNDFRAPVIPRPWKRAAIWQHSNGQFGPFKSVPGLGRVDVNALHPDVSLGALRLRPEKSAAGKPAKPADGKPATGKPRPEDDAPVPVHVPPVDVVVPVAPAEPVPPVIDPAPPATVAPPASVALPGIPIVPTVTTTTNGSTPGDAGSITVTITVPLPATPAPVLITPDLGDVEEQLSLAARSVQGAIDSLPERPEQ